MTLHLFLLLAAGLFAIGLFGALAQQSIVMIMMGIELMIGGVIVGAAAFWRFLAPAVGSGQVIVVAAVVAMAVEMAMGFAVTTAIFRTRRIDMADMAKDLEG
ncbi:NADH-quinone oxidoreductase subunit K [Sphaerisporangium krabiense]|uniref:NADH-quinone oxidoreductase subunit K n=1 Tax=Sphaerisporangium krabiense TaxID=763782 RepID=A0A7W8Z213_9ACTN|nr:NADH-quinone oxidoreductase subunit K [Sphaerisporangium krabiense]MBB5625925.1 NAD(P)H-quinone oxidoreductase subunit 4L [Sphaerisporangium krabiense]GII64728.1 NADH-quinone oxidoreductase subunit K [Sphaerisporangium krabiense]